MTTFYTNEENKVRKMKVRMISLICLLEQFHDNNIFLYASQWLYIENLRWLNQNQPDTETEKKKKTNLKENRMSQI